MGKQINRRQFIRGLGAGIITLSLSGCNISDNSTAVPTSKPSVTPKATPLATPTDAALAIDSRLFVAEGTDPETLIKNGLKALGGIEQLVKKDASVVIKPNFSVPRKPEEGATTNPQLVAAVVKQCLEAGAKEVKVIDFPFTTSRCLITSGIQEAVEEAGGKAYALYSMDYFQEIEINGSVLKKTDYSIDVLKADVFINMPILKHHSITGVTIGLKNMMGLIYNRDSFHAMDLNQCIAELNTYRKPDLIILDAIRGIIDHGPVGPGECKEWGQVIFGYDPVAVDAYGADLFGVVPKDITHIAAAAALGLGEIDLNKLTIEKV